MSDMTANPLKHGYLLAQSLMTSGPDNPWKERFSSFCLTSRQEAVPYLDRAAEFVDGLELQLITYSRTDLDVTLDISRCARDKGMDVWLCPRPYKYIHNLPDVPRRLAAFTMNQAGYIIPALAMNYSYHYVPDPLNPDASDFLAEGAYESYWKYFRGIANGYMWPEEKLDTQGGNLMGAPVVVKKLRGFEYYHTEYWRVPVYSDRALELWREYCRDNSVEYQGRPVDKFPVDKPDMVKNGGGKTACFPGHNPIDDIWSVPVKDLPRPQGVWKHWFNFLTRTYTQNHLIRLSRHWQRMFGQERADWRGVLYFGSSPCMLAYEDFAEQEGFLPPGGRAEGRRMGVDLKTLAQAPEIDYVIHESPKDDDPYLIEQFNHLVPEPKRGLMLHADGASSLTLETEEHRWEMIRRYQPGILALYPLWNLIQEKVVWRPGPIKPGQAADFRNPAAFRYFKERLREYQKGS